MNEPWLGVDRWRNGQIKIKSLSIQFFVLLLFFVVWTAMVTPLLLSEWHSLMRKFSAWSLTDFQSFDPKLLILLMPIVSLLMIKPLLRFWWEWKTLKNVRLTLDPYPGQIGGQVGGSLSLPFAYQQGMPADVRVSCIRASISGHGKNRSRSDSVKWRTKAHAQAEYETHQSTRVSFVADIDPGLEASDLEESTPYTYWAVRIKLPAFKFDQEFEIPVFVTDSPQSSRLVVDEQSSAPDEIIPDGVADYRQTSDGYAFHFLPGRSGVMANVLTLVGIVCMAVAGFMWFNVANTLQADQTRFFPLLVEFMIAMGFSLIGLPVFLWGLFEKHNSLAVILDNDWFMVSRSAFGKTFQELIARSDIHSLSKSVTAQSGQGAKSEVYYTIKLETIRGQKFTVADGIQGQPAADAILELMKAPLDFNKDTVPLDTKAPIPTWLKGLLPMLKLFSTIMVLVTVAAFVYDFMQM